MSRIPIGAPVRIGPRYLMGGTYAYDNYTGTLWYVSGPKTREGDYPLASEPGGDTHLWCNFRRCQENPCVTASTHYCRGET